MPLRNERGDSVLCRNITHRSARTLRMKMVREFGGVYLLSLSSGTGCHLLDHGDNELAVRFVQAGGVAANLREKTHFVFRERRQRTAIGVLLGEKLSQRQFHGRGDFRQRVERRNGVSIFYAGKVAAQQAGFFLNVALRHSLAHPVVPNGFANIHSLASSLPSCY